MAKHNYKAVSVLIGLIIFGIFFSCFGSEKEKDINKKAVSIATRYPFCDSAISPEAKKIIGALAERKLAVDCNSDIKKAEFAAPYSDLRIRMLANRSEIRALPREKALALVHELLPHVLAKASLPPWMGTTWNFYGSSSVPGKGEIACGYFVAATLYASGFNVRISLQDKDKRHFHLAGLPSEKIIKKLVAPGSIQRFSNKTVAEVKQAVKAAGPGVYIAGLDYHVGFLFYDGVGDVLFFHSKPNHSVTLEPPEDAPFFAQSNYRVIGKLDAKTAKLWLDGSSI